MAISGSRAACDDLASSSVGGSSENSTGLLITGKYVGGSAGGAFHPITQGSLKNVTGIFITGIRVGVDAGGSFLGVSSPVRFSSNARGWPAVRERSRGDRHRSISRSLEWTIVGKKRRCRVIVVSIQISASHDAVPLGISIVRLFNFPCAKTI